MIAAGRRTDRRAALWALALLSGAALACGSAGLAQAETTPPDSASPQPALPKPITGLDVHALDTLGGPDSGIGPAPRRRAAHRHRHHRYAAVAPIERPALAGVELVEPLPPPPQPPHFTVPVPGYPLENFITAYTTPLAPVVCHPRRRDPDLPDPRLYREVPVVCTADNP